MARKRINNLDTLIPAYAENKAMLDDYKKICDDENKQIKELMEEGSYETGGWKATKTIQHRETMNEDALMRELDLLDGMKKYFEENNLIKTKEYIDFDGLEALIYTLNNKKDDESKQIVATLIEMLDECRETKEVVTLKVTKVKEKKE